MPNNIELALQGSPVAPLTTYEIALVKASEAGREGVSMKLVAEILVAGGWPVFPCGQNKSPLVAGGFKARSKDPLQVERWWNTHADAMPGICPGDGGLVALDVDSTSAADVATGLGLGFASGLVVETGGTSKPFVSSKTGEMWNPMHVYVRVAEEPRITGLVVRYKAGYVIAPGSRRGDRLYRVVALTAPPTFGGTQVNGAVRPRVSEEHHPKMASQLERVAAAVSHIPNTEHTTRDHYVAMAHMIRGSAGEAGRDIFLAWAAKYPGVIDTKEDERVFDTIGTPRTGWRELWSYAQLHGFDATREIQEDAQDDFAAVATDQPATVTITEEDTRTKLNRMLTEVVGAEDGITRALALMRLRKAGFSGAEVRMMLAEQVAVKSDEGNTIAELCKSPELLKLPEPAISYLTWPGLKTVLSAREKGGKSTLAMAGACIASEGGTFLDLMIPKQRILWMTEEPRVIPFARACETLKDRAPTNENLVVVSMDRNPQAQLRRALQRWAPQVVVIDTLFRFSCVDAEDENKSVAWMPTILMFDEVTNGGAALLLLAHMQRHGTEYRGSSAIGGFVDAILEMQRPKNVDDRIRRITGRGRLSFGKPFAVRLLDTGAFELLGDVEAVVTDTLQQTILDVLGDNENGLSGSTLATTLHVDKSRVLRALESLKSGKQVFVEGSGNRTKWKIVRDDLTPVTEAPNGLSH